MKNIIPYLPTVLIIILFSAAFLGYNKVISNQARQNAIYEATRIQIEEMNDRHSEQNKRLDSLILLNNNLDSLIHRNEKQLEYLKGQNEEIYSSYRNITIDLPEL